MAQDRLAHSKFVSPSLAVCRTSLDRATAQGVQILPAGRRVGGFTTHAVGTRLEETVAPFLAVAEEADDTPAGIFDSVGEFISNNFLLLLPIVGAFTMVLIILVLTGIVLRPAEPQE